MSRKKWSSEKIFHRLLNNKSKKTYWDNVSELRSRPNKKVYDLAYSLTQSEIKREKIIGIDVLAQLGFAPRLLVKKTIRRYFEILDKEKDPNVLMSILFAISHNNKNLSSNQISKLIKFQNHKDYFVRQGLVSALSAIENKKAIDALIKLSTDKISSIRDWATFAIGDLIDIDNLEIRNALWERINDKNENTRLEAIVGLANRKDIRVKDIIIKELKKDNYDSLIFEAINVFSNKEFLPYLKLASKTSKRDKNTSEYWLQELENCIKELKK